MGLDPLTANASNAVAIWPGHAAAVPAYAAELRRAGRTLLPRTAIAALGGLVGAGTLLWAGERAFTAAVPWLLLAATLLFAAGPTIRAASERLRLTSPRRDRGDRVRLRRLRGIFSAPGWACS